MEAATDFLAELEKLSAAGFRIGLTKNEVWALTLKGGPLRGAKEWHGTNPSDLIAAAAQWFRDPSAIPAAEIASKEKKSERRQERLARALPQEPDEHRDRPKCAGAGKVIYSTEREADEAAVAVTWKNLMNPRLYSRTGVRSYGCGVCGNWHVTSMPWNPELADRSVAPETRKAE